MNHEAEIRQFIATELLQDERGASLTEDQALITSGLVDSMGLLKILAFVQQKFGVDLMAVGSPMDFDSVAALAAAIRRVKNG
ncbi:MAG: acyl carrier protein [bacterium]